MVALSFAQNNQNENWRTKDYIVYKDYIVQQNKYMARVLSATEIVSNYQSPANFFKVQYCLSSLALLEKTMKVAAPQSIRRVEMEEIIPSSSFNYKGFSGKGFVEIGKNLNTVIPLQVLV